MGFQLVVICRVTQPGAWAPWEVLKVLQPPFGQMEQSSGKSVDWVARGSGQVGSPGLGTWQSAFFPLILLSELSNALEYLKLLNSFVDSVGVMAPPFTNTSVLKSALGESLGGGSLFSPS